MGNTIHVIHSNCKRKATGNECLDAALEAAARGWLVFPVHGMIEGNCTCRKAECDKPGKHPRTAHGLHDATTQESQVRDWWANHPGSNVGVRTGAESGIIVLDVDGRQGEDALEGLISKHGKLPATVEAESGRGRHLYFKHPGGLVPSRNGALASGLDIKGEGGYIVMPPSRHHSGKVYSWALFSDPGTISPADAPPWLIDLICKKNRKQTGINATPLSSPLDGVEKGKRDEMLFHYACNLRRKGLRREEVEPLVVEAARKCSPPFPETEARRKVESAFSYAESATKSMLDDPHLTDLGNAQRLSLLYGDRIRYSKALGYLVYDGRRWVPDNLAEVQKFAKETVKGIYKEAASVLDDDARTALVRHAARSESAPRIKAMLELLPSEPGISVLPEIFDQDKMVLNVANGTLDLRTGELRPHSPTDMITKLAPVKYDAAVTCDHWLRFLDEIMDGDPELVSFLQRLLGYALTGETREQAWVFLWGKGSNGKGTFMDTVSYVLGDYAINTPAETFLETSGNTIRNDLARLRGARLVTASEPSSGRFDPAVLKTFTGQDPITARFLHREFFDFYPEGKLFFSANQRPSVRDASYGFWRRVLMIPFRRVFKEEPDENQNEQRKDHSLRDSLKAEAPGILAWMVEGCRQWLREGLNPPAVVRAAVEDYRNESDILADFFDACCAFGKEESVPVGDLYPAYLEFCDENSIKKPLSKQKFNEDLLARPGITKSQVGKARTHTWFGIGFGSPEARPNVVKGDFQRGKSEETCEECDIPPGACPIPEGKKNAPTCSHFQPI